MKLFAFLVKNIFRVYEGSEKYKRFKEKPKRVYYCDECSHKIQLEAIKNFLDNYINFVSEKFDNKIILNYHMKKLICKMAWKKVVKKEYAQRALVAEKERYTS